MAGFNPRWIRGKTVESVDMRVFDDGRGCVAHNPMIRFTDGSFIFFVTEETESGEYGTDVVYVKATKATKATKEEA